MEWELEVCWDIYSAGDREDMEEATEVMEAGMEVDMAEDMEGEVIADTVAEEVDGEDLLPLLRLEEEEEVQRERAQHLREREEDSWL